MLILVEDATEPVAPEGVETGVKIRLEIGWGSACSRRSLAMP
jgi:hypothetical protein